MRYLILSDIHSNCEALTAVLAHVKRKHWDKAVVLGDTEEAAAPVSNRPAAVAVAFTAAPPI